MKGYKMCGRFALTASVEAVESRFSTLVEMPFPPLYNIAPSQGVLVVKAPEAYRPPSSNRAPYDSVLARWGFIPAWTRNPDKWPLTINIRAETVHEKKSFQNALRYHRVIIPASGFYEWKKRSGHASRPFYICHKEQPLIGFAGLMETWSGAEGSQIDTVAIITKASTGSLKAIHHRMPVILSPQMAEDWLDCRNMRPRDILDYLRMPCDDGLEAVPISNKINNAAYRGADVQKAIVVDDNKQEKLLKNDGQLHLF